MLADLKMAGYIKVIDYVWMGSCVCKSRCFMQERLLYTSVDAYVRGGCSGR